MVVLRSKEILIKFKILLVLIFWSTNLYADNRFLLPGFDPFITTWQTTGVDNNITIPLTGSGYDFTIDWGDETPTEIKTGTPGNISHTYSSSGIKTVSITPNILTGFPRIYVNNQALKSNLLTIESWGSGKWGALLSNAFLGANNLEIKATDVPNFSETTSFSSMFQNCTSLTGANGFSNWTLNTTAPVSFSSMFAGATKFNGDISNWEVSSVVSMFSIFSGAYLFNQDISNWIVSNVTNTGSMFNNARAFNQDLSKWNVSMVTNMSTMFAGTYVFDQALTTWDVSNVTTMENMFSNARGFNGDISGWDVSKVTTMQLMFADALVFNNTLNTWVSTTGNVTNMYRMFYQAGKFNQSINNWDVSKVQNTNQMFYRARSFNQDLDLWDVSSLIDARLMFEEATAFNGNMATWQFTTDITKNVSLFGMFKSATLFNSDISAWNTKRVTIMDQMFASSLIFNQDISNWDVSNVIGMSSMFSSARNFNQDLSKWNVSNAVNMSSMFAGTYLFNQPLTAWDVSNVTTMANMFYNARAFNGDISGWDVSKVTTMQGMFTLAAVFNNSLNAWGAKTGKVINMSLMFQSATAFNQNIDGWDVSKVTNTSLMFYKATSFNQNLNSWDVSSVTNAGQMFHEAKAFNGDISSWRFTTELTKTISMASIFRDASSFNQDISGWNVERVNQMQRMFQGTPFNQDISAWDISNVTNFQLFLNGGKLSRANYDKILVGWSTLDAGETKIPINLTVDFGASKYSNDPTVLTARDTELRSSKNWTITDGGMDSDFVFPIINSNLLASSNTSISITFSEGVYKTSLGSGTLEISDFLFSLSGGAATLNTTTPSSISTSNNLTFILGIDINGTPNGAEVLTVTPVLDAIFDLSGNAAATSQDNNTVLLNDLSPPNISMPSGDAVSITENSTAVFTFTASKSVTWSLGTANDAALLNIDSSGNLAFNTAPDFENPISTLSSNTYAVDVIATDAASNTATQTLTITVLDIPSTTFGTFATINKQYFAGPHTIVPPTTTNSNPIFYTSDNTAVATISGSVITFTGIGTATITATQATDINYEGGTVSTLLTVLGKDLVSKYGGISSTDVNYTSANGEVGGAFGIDKYGRKVEVSGGIITSGLVMHLDAGNPASYSGTGTSWTDISGNGNHGTLFGGVGYTSVNSGALVFDGVNDYFVTNNNFNLSSTDKLTVQIIIKTTSTRSEMIMEHSVNWNNNNSYGVIINNTNDKVQFTDKNQGYNVRNSVVAINDNNWHLFSATTDRSLNATDQTLIYIDGRTPSSVIVPTLANDNSGNYTSHKLYIASRAGSSYLFNGTIAQVFIYNRVLTALEIQQNYNAIKIRYGL